MPRRVPCPAFRDGAGELDRTLFRFAAERCDRMGCTALRDNVPRTAFALATLRGNAEFELHFVKCHPGSRMACDFAIGHSATYANDHGRGRQAGWQLVGALIINKNPSHLQ